MDPQFPVLPTFESDDLLLLTSEIEKARHYLAQSRSFRELFQDTPKPHEKGKLNATIPQTVGHDPKIGSPKITGGWRDLLPDFGKCVCSLPTSMVQDSVHLF